MRIIRVCLLIGCVLFAASCAQFARDSQGANQRKAAAPAAPEAPSNPFICLHPACDEIDASRALDAALTRCSNTQNVYEKQGFNERRGQFALAVVGALAGAVAAPLAKGSGTRAWSGLSGATNGLQAQLDQQFSNALSVQERQAVANTMTADMQRFRDAETNFERVAEAVFMANDCRQASAKADAAARQAIDSAANRMAATDAAITEKARSEKADSEKRPADMNQPDSSTNTGKKKTNEK